MKRVNARAILIRKEITGEDPLVDKILSTEDSLEKQLFLKAQDINTSPLKKGYVEASLLCCSDLDKISNVIEVPVPVLAMYAAVFYDVLDLDKLSRMELLDVRDKEEGLLKLWALSQGLEFVAWRMGKQIQISPVEGLVDLFTTCMYKSKEAMFTANAQDASKEATKWVKLSIDISRLLKLWTMDSAAAKREIELAIKEVIPEFEGLDTVLEPGEISSNIPIGDEISFGAIPEDTSD